VPHYEPLPEMCNGLDDDCDGDSDEGLGVSVTCGVGACAKTIVACTDGTPVDCVPGTAGTEICNGIDDDCDGSIDEDYQGHPTTCGVGACASSGTSQCVGGAHTCPPARTKQGAAASQTGDESGRT